MSTCPPCITGTGAETEGSDTVNPGCQMGRVAFAGFVDGTTDVVGNGITGPVLKVGVEVTGSTGFDNSCDRYVGVPGIGALIAGWVVGTTLVAGEVTGITDGLNFRYSSYVNSRSDAGGKGGRGNGRGNGGGGVGGTGGWGSGRG